MGNNDGGVVRVRKGFISYRGGVRRVVRAGQLMRSDDPLVAEYGDQMFESISDRVEQMTAVPGESRQLPRGSRRARREARRDAEARDAAQGADEASERVEAAVHVGGGYYELPNGERVQGKDEADARLAQLQDVDGA